jgi:plastocyanin
VIQATTPAVLDGVTIRATIPPLLLALAIPVSGCGSSAAPARHRATIAISGYAYRPPRITVTAGTAITFTNDDATAHTATATGGQFDSGTVSPGHSRTIVLRTAGTYTYYCQFHPFMRATITVKSSST